MAMSCVLSREEQGASRMISSCLVGLLCMLYLGLPDRQADCIEQQEMLASLQLTTVMSTIQGMKFHSFLKISYVHLASCHLALLIELQQLEPRLQDGARLP